jgi:hypothetical protein
MTKMKNNPHLNDLMNKRRIDGVNLEKEALQREISIEERIKRQRELNGNAKAL